VSQGVKASIDLEMPDLVRAGDPPQIGIFFSPKFKEMRKRLSATRPLQVNEPKQGAKLDLQMQ
jgi:hypothetical protein